MDNKNQLSVTILGISAAIPTKTRHLSGQVVINSNQYFLVDCGEGTQMQLISFGIKYSKIDNIFISHLHGDHFFGLIGLISTYHLLGREKSLNIFAPKPLEDIIRYQLDIAHTKLKFELLFHHLSDIGNVVIFENELISISSFPVTHRVPTYGFRFDQKPKKRNIDKIFLSQHNPTINQILGIKNGNDFTDTSGKVLKNSSITIAPPKPKSYAYCSDTKFDTSIVNHINEVDLLFHEATFDNSMVNIALEKYHSTAEQAAIIAKTADVKELLLGHFSGRNEDLSILYDEAKKVFDKVTICEEGQKYFA